MKIIKYITNFFTAQPTAEEIGKMLKPKLIKLAAKLGTRKTGKKEEILAGVLEYYGYKNPGTMRGYIYIIEGRNSNCLKIGRTKHRESEALVLAYLRRRYHTALGKNLNICLFPVEDQYAAEKKIQIVFDKYRQKGTELFDLKFEVAKNICAHLL